MNTGNNKFIKGQTLIEFVLIISFLMFIILGIMQFAIIYGIKLMVNYAAYTSCRVGIVNYDENGRFDMEKIRSSALMSISPVTKRISSTDAENFGLFEIGSNIYGGNNVFQYADRMQKARLILEIESPDENRVINLRKVRMSERCPKLTVKLIYWYRPVFPFICRLFENKETTVSGRSKESSFIAITGSASMPVEIGPPFTPEM